MTHHPFARSDRGRFEHARQLTVSARAWVLAIATLLGLAQVATAQVSFEVVPGLTAPLGTPYGGLLQIGNEFYGTAYAGGDFAQGSVFRVNASGLWTTLYHFTGGADGRQPWFGLTLGTDGALYGTTTRGALGFGTIFRIGTDGSFSTVHQFQPSGLPVEGGSPFGRLLQGADGYLYGTTSSGPGQNHTVFRFDTSSQALTTLHVFWFTPDFCSPSGELVQAVDGSIYGTASAGRSPTVYGRVFKVAPSGTVTTLHRFTGGPESSDPIGGLVEGPDGALYGTSTNGGDFNQGTIFRITSAGAVTTLHRFNGADGSDPIAALVVGPDVRLYGTTSGGGNANKGTIFAIDTTGAFETLHHFSGSNGDYPFGPLALATDGWFYGTTGRGGPGGGGLVFRFRLPNTPPVATDQSISTAEDTSASLTLAATDADNDPLTYTVVAGPSHGTLSGTAPDLTYTPAADYFGTDSFTFTASDSYATSNTGVVSITVVSQPEVPVIVWPTPADIAYGTPLSATQLNATASVPGTFVYSPAAGTVPGAGTHTLSTVFTPADAVNYSQVSAATTLVVTPATTTITLVATQNPAATGDLVTLTATVTSSAGVPTGTVAIYWGDSLLVDAVLDATGRAVVDTLHLPTGYTAPLAAIYSGAGDFASSSASLNYFVATDGRFVEQPRTSISTSAIAVATAELNGDGHTDVLVASATPTDGLVVTLGTGTGALTLGARYDTGGTLKAMTTADFDLDGDADVAVVNVDGTVVTLAGQGDGTFAPAVPITSVGEPRTILSGDLNGDGRPDLVVVYHTGAVDSFRVFLGGAAGFTAVATESSADGHGTATLADVNGDGMLDIAHAPSSLDTGLDVDIVHTLTGSGNGTFAAPVSWPVPLAPQSTLAVREVTGDQFPDLIVVGAPPGSNNHAVTVLPGLGGGAFGAAVPYPVSSAYDVAFLDADANGSTDIAVVGAQFAGRLSVLRADGTGGFRLPSSYGWINPQSLAVADFNEDGAPDIVATDGFFQPIAVFLNTGGVGVTLTATPNPATAGEAVTLTAQVAATVAGAGTVSGTVTFFDGATTLGVAPLLGGSATSVTSTLSTGPHTITARYNGSAEFGPRGSAPVVVDVSGPIPLAAVLQSPNGGERVFVGVPSTIRWTSSRPAASFDVQLSRNGGTTFTTLTGCASLPGTATSCGWTPLAPGNTTARVRVIGRDPDGDVSDDSDANFTISTATPNLTVTTPNTAATWLIGSPQTLRWNHNLGIGARMRVELSRDGGTSWEVLAASVTSTSATSGAWPWTVTGPPTATALVRVTWLDGALSDVSNVAFTMARATVTVTVPNTSLSWTIGTPRTISWTHDVPAGLTMDVDVSRDGGATWSVIGTGLPNTSATRGSFSWVVTGPVTPDARVRVRATTDPLVSDVNDVDAFFVAPSIAVTAPSTAVTWRVGSTQTLRVLHNLGTGQTVEFQVSRDGGASWSVLGQVPTTTSTFVTYPWLVSLPVTSTASVRAVWTAMPSVADTSVNFAVISRITVATPSPTQSWAAGSLRTVSWTHNLPVSEPLRVDVSVDNGASWTLVASNVTSTTASTGSATVRMPATPSTATLLRVTQIAVSENFDENDAPFALVAPTLTVSAPNGAVTWAIGSVRTIAWTHNLGSAETAAIDVSRDDGATWSVIAPSLPMSSATSGNFAWTVAGPATNVARVRVRWTANPVVADGSNASFRIQ